MTLYLRGRPDNANGIAPPSSFQTEPTAFFGFEGDTSNHLGIPEWYERHVEAWARYASPQTTLWFWNSEIGWAAAHPIIEKHGWRYAECQHLEQGEGARRRERQHGQDSVDSRRVRGVRPIRFEARIAGLPLKEWLLKEWKRTDYRSEQPTPLVAWLTPP